MSTNRDVDMLLNALRKIAARGGNLPDDRLINKQGPHASVQRGLMYVDSRDIAMEAIARFYDMTHHNGENPENDHDLARQ